MFVNLFNIPIITVILLFGNSINVNYAMMGSISVGILIASAYLVYLALRSKPVPEEMAEKEEL